MIEETKLSNTTGQPQGVGIRALFALVMALGCAGCHEKSPEMKGDVKVLHPDETGYLQVRTVVLDGNEYYATRTHGGNWTLCPKLPPKAEK
jgi:hypothetical protein